MTKTYKLVLSSLPDSAPVWSGDTEPTYCPTRGAWLISGPHGAQYITDQLRKMHPVHTAVADVQAYPTVSRTAFKLLWPGAARIEIYDTLVKTDPIVKDFIRMLDDPKTDAIELAVPEIRLGIAHIVSILESIKPEDKAAVTEAICSGKQPTVGEH
jgi:hypothetical protein